METISSLMIGFGVALQPFALLMMFLGLVLGPTLEKEFRTAMIWSEGNLNVFYTSPVALIFFGLTLLIIGRQIWTSYSERRSSNGAAPPTGQKTRA